MIIMYKDHSEAAQRTVKKLRRRLDSILSEQRYYSMRSRRHQQSKYIFIRA